MTLSYPSLLCSALLGQQGDAAGPMGARAIAQRVNGDGGTLRGRPFNNSNAAGILARAHYTGRYHDMRRDSRTGQLRPRVEWVDVACPAIITQDTFDTVQALRTIRNPQRTPPRITSGPTLLTAKIGRAHV